MKKRHLFVFNNLVYDLREHKFIEFKHDDYASITTDYDWIEPTEQQINVIDNIISSIISEKNERQLFLEILGTGLEGRCLERFILFSGTGRNGKGLINDLYLKTLGDYGMIGNNVILFEKNKTGSNPEKNNLHKKRYVVFREPAKNNKFENSIIKELTGGGNFSARGHQESITQKKTFLTTIVECNDRPLFSEDPQIADLQRLIYLQFNSTFTENIDEVNHKKNIFLANKKFKDYDFQEEHKRALFYLVSQAHKNYHERNYVLDIPMNVKDRSISYFQMSCDILGWVNDNYIRTESKKDIIKIKDMFDIFKYSEYYINLTKNEKRKYNYQYFIKQFAENVFFNNFYKHDMKKSGHILMFYKSK